METRRQQIDFFARNAGYCTPPGRLACAKALADAETAMRAYGWTVAWEYDECFDWSDTPDGADPGCCDWCNRKLDSRGNCSTDHEAFTAVLTDAGGNVLDSLGGIVDPDANYRRVIEAELASNALHTERQAARDCAL